MSIDTKKTRRLALTLHKPALALYAGIRPTLVIDGRGQPTQWGLGTWQIPTDRPVTMGVYLFNRLWRFGEVEFTLDAGQNAAVTYRAPILPFLRGRILFETAEPPA